MVTGKRFRELCLALGGVEHPHFDRAAFRAGAKGLIFATLANDGSDAMVKLDVDACEGLIRSQPAQFFSLGGWSRMGATGVALKAMAVEPLRALLLDAFQLAERPAKKTARATLKTTAPAAPKKKAARAAPEKKAARAAPRKKAKQARDGR